MNVAVRAHYAPLFSRLGAYPRKLLDEAAWAHSARRPRLLVEYWAHEASLLPVQDWPLLRGRGQAPRLVAQLRSAAEREPGLVDDVLAAVKELGPIGAGELEAALGGPDRSRVDAPRAASWWNRSDVKRICEWLFGIGQLTTGTPAWTSSGSTTCPSGCCRRAVLAAPAPQPEAAAAGADPAGRRRAGRGHRARPARLLPACAGTQPAGGGRAGRRPACWSRSRCVGWRQPAYRHAGRPDAAAGRPAARCCARSTR